MHYIKNLQKIINIHLKNIKGEQLDLKLIVNIYSNYKYIKNVQNLCIARKLFRYGKLKILKKIKLFLKKINKRYNFIYLKIKIFSISHLLKFKYPKLKLSKKIKRLLKKIKKKK